LGPSVCALLLPNLMHPTLPHMTLRLCLVLLCPFLVASYVSDQLIDINAQLLDDGDARQSEVSLLSTQFVVVQHTVARDTESEAQTLPASWGFYHYSLFPLILITAVTAWYTRPQLDSPEDMTPSFLVHRYQFLAVWAVAVAADWLQGPYVYALYDSFGYDKSEIDKLFVTGFASSMVFGTFAGSFADAWGRKRTTLLYCILYIVSCLTKHCSTYSVLMFGRVTGGMATSLLFSAFECWMVSENNERHGFSPALLRYMFSMMYFVNYLVAIVSGLFAQILVDAVPMRRFQGYSSLHYGGNICPFDLAIVMLCIAFPTICYTWRENYGSQDSLSGLNARASPVESFKAAWKAITSSWKISVLGIICACFEGSMYTFVINWTPTLAVEGGPPVPHGLIFSAMMMCCMIGSSVFSFLNPRVNPAKAIGFVSVLAALAFAFISFEVGKVAYVSTIYMSFLVFEFCVGLYFPAMGALKSEVVPEEVRAGIYNWYRVPLNLVVCSIILTDMQLQPAFAACGILMAVGAIFAAPVALDQLSAPAKLPKARDA